MIESSHALPPTETTTLMIVNGGGVSKEGMLAEPSRLRVEAAADELELQSNLDVILTGARSFRQANRDVTEAEAMSDYLYQIAHVSVDQVWLEQRSLDSIGAALFTKPYALTRNLRHVKLVTSRQHMPRLTEIYDHVYGPGFRFEPVYSAEKPTLYSRGYEVIGSVLLNEIIRGTEPGDDAAVQERLFAHMPGYDTTSGASIVLGEPLVGP